MKARPWTPKQEAVLRTRYVTDPTRAIAADLGRTPAAIRKRASILGIVCERPWAEADRSSLRLLWSEMTLKDLAKHLGRTESAVYTRAAREGLPLGCPRGKEFVSDAAKRTGFAVITLQRILKRHRVVVSPSMSRACGAARHHGVVDPLDVDEAVRAWLETETLEAAARSRGVSAERLQGALRALPGAPRKPRKKGGHWRIPSEVVERALGRSA